ncbi:Ribonuclease Z/Hydroxyacylglutathione hydrolase-like protein [Abortiporus biennis]
MSTLPPHHANPTRTHFHNPWPPLQSISRSALSLLKLPIERDGSEGFSEEFIAGIDVTTIPLTFEQSRYEEKGSLSVAWLGHAGFLLEFHTSNGQTLRVLCDPIFADRASPSKYFGPKRRLPPPCTVDDFPSIDFVVISHNHYDHLDEEFISQLNARFPGAIQYMVPLGVKLLLVSLGIAEDSIHELDWWEEKQLPGSDLEFICTPAQHNSGRGVLDQSTTLWASWIIRLRPHAPTCEIEKESLTSLEIANRTIYPSVWFAGDTGYQTASGPCPAFKEIGDRHGPFDLALIPIWRGASLSFLSKLGYRLTDDNVLATLHATPEDAVHMQHDVKARRAIAMHFATFVGSVEEAREPVQRLKNASKGTWTDLMATDNTGKLRWRKDGGFGVVNIGQRVDVI